LINSDTRVGHEVNQYYQPGFIRLSPAVISHWFIAKALYHLEALGSLPIGAKISFKHPKVCLTDFFDSLLDPNEWLEEGQVRSGHLYNHSIHWVLSSPLLLRFQGQKSISLVFDGNLNSFFVERYNRLCCMDTIASVQVQHCFTSQKSFGQDLDRYEDSILGLSATGTS
jgi:hypothetical protein